MPANASLNVRYERWRWQIFGITWLIYAGFYLTRNSFAVAKVALVDDSSLALSREHLGLVDSAFLTTYMLGQFLFGALGDRFGPRRILLCGLSLSILAAVAAGFATVLMAFVVLAVTQGMAQSTGWSNTNKTMSSWFSLSERGRVTGWWCSNYAIGAAVSLPFAGWMMDYFGALRLQQGATTKFTEFWPAAFWVPAAALTLILLLAWFLLRSRPEDVGLPPIEQYRNEPITLIEGEETLTPATDGSWKLIGEVLSSPSIWMLALAYFSIKLTRYAFIFWGPKLVAESFGSSAYQSTMTAAIFPVGGVLGVIGIGYVSDKLFQARRAPATIISLLVTAGIMLLGMSPMQNIWVMGLFFFFVGVFILGPDSMLSATAAMDFGTKRGASTATGFVNGVGSLGGILGGYLPGAITTETDWSALFGVCLVGLTFSAIILVPLWRAKPPTANAGSYTDATIF
jgi:MFS transporter, OPA family, glycerol-3-phosphate transporter